VSLSAVSPLLICPRCGSGLIEIDGRFRCSSGSCIFGESTGFPAVGRWPVFVDFDSSILSSDAERTEQDARAKMRPMSRALSESFPGWLRRLWKPTNRVAEQNVEVLLSLLSGSSPLVLVVGGGTEGNGIQALYADGRIRLLAFDIYASPLTQFIADAHQIPLADGSVDAVVVQAVLEHVLDPAGVVREIHRVLRDRGLVYAETPFLQQVHAGAYDFTRFTNSGHRYLFRAFEEIDDGPVAGPGTQLLWTVDHVVRGVLRSQLAGRIARVLFFWLRYVDGLIPKSFAMDSASAFFFLGRRADRELTPQQVVQYYQGAQRSQPK
jgi:SAM-dependent methyltransferase